MSYFDREINKGMAIYRKYTIFSKNHEKLCEKLSKSISVKKMDSLILEVLHDIKSSFFSKPPPPQGFNFFFKKWLTFFSKNKLCSPYLDNLTIY